MVTPECASMTQVENQSQKMNLSDPTQHRRGGNGLGKTDEKGEIFVFTKSFTKI